MRQNLCGKERAALSLWSFPPRFPKAARVLGGSVRVCESKLERVGSPDNPDEDYEEWSYSQETSCTWESLPRDLGREDEEGWTSQGSHTEHRL